METVYSGMARSLSEVRPMLTGPGAALRPLTTGNTRPSKDVACNMALPIVATMVPLLLVLSPRSPAKPVTTKTGQG